MISIILLCIVILAIASLLFPVTMNFNSVRSGGKIEGIFSLSWIILDFRYKSSEKRSELHILGRCMVSRTSLKRKEPEPRKKIIQPKKSEKIPPVRDIINLAGPLFQLLRDLIYIFRPKYLDIDLTFGANDPAYTGIMTGFLHAAGLSGKDYVRWNPVFTKQMLDWKINVRSRVRPIQLFPPVLRFVTDLQVLRSIRGFMT